MHTQHYHLGYSLKITNEFLTRLTGPGEPPVFRSNTKNSPAWL